MSLLRANFTDFQFSPFRLDILEAIFVEPVGNEERNPCLARTAQIGTTVVSHLKAFFSETFIGKFTLIGLVSKAFWTWHCFTNPNF
jgi:hypothetical protein